MPHSKAIFDKLPKDTPAIHFGTGNPELYPAMKEAGGDVIGIDWRISIDEAWSRARQRRRFAGQHGPGSAPRLARRHALAALPRCSTAPQAVAGTSSI